MARDSKDKKKKFKRFTKLGFPVIFFGEPFYDILFRPYVSRWAQNVA